MWRVKVLLVLGMVAGMLLVPATARAGFGIDPGKVFIDNLYPGAQADVPVTIYNQNTYDATFQVRVRQPDYTEEGYEPLPYPGWVTITPDSLTIEAGGEEEVLVIIAMPPDADYSGKKCEVWVTFAEQGSSGMVRIEIASRFLITTRIEAKESTPPRKTITLLLR